MAYVLASVEQRNGEARIRIYPYHADSERIYGRDHDLADEVEYGESAIASVFNGFGDARLYLAGVFKYDLMFAIGR
jgi:hypothetical protein